MRLKLTVKQAANLHQVTAILLEEVPLRQDHQLTSLCVKLQGALERVGARLVGEDWRLLPGFDSSRKLELAVTTKEAIIAFNAVRLLSAGEGPIAQVMLECRDILQAKLNQSGIAVLR